MSKIEGLELVEAWVPTGGMRETDLYVAVRVPAKAGIHPRSMVDVYRAPQETSVHLPHGAVVLIRRAP